MMETGYDILFFWVARMIMSGMYFTARFRSVRFICMDWFAMNM
jgi:valyl-tRNA synthetase